VKSEIRRPKPEGRSKSEIRIPKNHETSCEFGFTFLALRI
jgi:hypothetical protein